MRLVLTAGDQWDLTLTGAEEKTALAASGVQLLALTNEAAATRKLIVIETARFPWIGLLWHNDGAGAVTPVIKYTLVNGGLLRQAMLDKT